MLAPIKCKGSLPHQFKTIAEFNDILVESCVICGFKARWNKDSKGRTNNIKYLKLHAGDFCQPTGSTKALYYKIYHPHYCITRICLNDKCNKKGICKHKQGNRTELRIDNRIKGSNKTYWK